VLQRVEKMGDLFAAVQTLKQRLPDAQGMAKEETVDLAAQAEEEPRRAKAAAKRAKATPKRAAGKSARKKAVGRGKAR
jgi:hypothetical protein